MDFARVYTRDRLKTAILCGLAVGTVFVWGWKTGAGGLYWRTIVIALWVLTVFGVFEQWPRQLPRWMARWALQVIMVAVTIPPFVAIIYWLSTQEGAPPFYKVKERMEGYSGLTMFFLLTAPWATLTAIFRQKDALARDQALKLDLAKSELERQGLESRMRLLQAQVQPHFLFNTLANVRELVEAGSPQAPAVLNHLISYLRAVVPRLDDPMNTLEQEMQLVRAYLEVMHMRMPDRLKFDIHVDEAALKARCPPMTLLTLVENAVRHGIDPSEDGGRIEIRVTVEGDRIRASVRDSGVGMRKAEGGLGTGLATLRERLKLVFGAGAQLRVDSVLPRGVLAELSFPAQRHPGESRDPVS
ncbi:MAG: sensor histidine kinase [Gammaproteobacteria bacterium]